MITPRTIRVVKVGGSLFDLPQLPVVLADWLARQTPAENVLLAGGGAMADLVRVADRQFQLDPAAAHWICVSVLTASARLIAALLPKALLIARFAELRAELSIDPPATIVFEVEDFLRTAEPVVPGSALPHDWRVTSDSIAARLAVSLHATELVLLKSTDLPSSTSRAAAAAAGLVDDHFPLAAQALGAVRWVNLRAPEKAEQVLT